MTRAKNLKPVDALKISELARCPSLLLRQLGYDYCLLAYNMRDAVGDGCFEPDNGGLSIYGKVLVDAYNRYGMVVDVSHAGERTALDAIEHSSDPIILSHSVAKSVRDFRAATPKN